MKLYRVDKHTLKITQVDAEAKGDNWVVLEESRVWGRETRRESAKIDRDRALCDTLDEANEYARNLCSEMILKTDKMIADLQAHKAWLTGMLTDLKNYPSWEGESLLANQRNRRER